jgi:hypothetical protein
VSSKAAQDSPGSTFIFPSGFQGLSASRTHSELLPGVTGRGTPRGLRGPPHSAEPASNRGSSRLYGASGRLLRPPVSSPARFHRLPRLLRRPRRSTVRPVAYCGPRCRVRRDSTVFPVFYDGLAAQCGPLASSLAPPSSRSSPVAPAATSAAPCGIASSRPPWRLRWSPWPSPTARPRAPCPPPASTSRPHPWLWQSSLLGRHHLRRPARPPVRPSRRLQCGPSAAVDLINFVNYVDVDLRTSTVRPVRPLRRRRLHQL